MQLTNKEVKSLLTDLYCKASQDDAIDMREFAVLMEGIREAVAHKNGCQSLKRLTINRQKYDTPVYWPYLIDFKKAGDTVRREDFFTFISCAACQQSALTNSPATIYSRRSG